MTEAFQPRQSRQTKRKASYAPRRRAEARTRFSRLVCGPLSYRSVWASVSVNVGNVWHVDWVRKCWKHMWNIFAEPYRRTQCTSGRTAVLCGAPEARTGAAGMRRNAGADMAHATAAPSLMGHARASRRPRMIMSIASSDMGVETPLKHLSPTQRAICP